MNTKKISFKFFALFTALLLLSCQESNNSHSGIVSSIAKDFEYALNNPTEISSISIKEKGIENIPESIDSRFVKLIQINLTNNKIKKLPESIGEIKTIKQLHLDNNKLMQIPVSIGDLNNLETLQLNKNELIELPNIAFNFKKDARVALRWNKIEFLPSSFSNSKFGYLYLTGNRLTELPENFGNLKELKELNIANNNISKLPDSFYDLKNLKQLDIRGTKLTKEDIDKIIAKMPKCVVKSDF